MLFRSDVTQPDSALTAIAVGFSVVPAVLVAVSLLWLRRYTLDDRVHAGADSALDTLPEEPAS